MLTTFVSPPACADPLVLPVPGTMVRPGAKMTPAHLKGILIDPTNPFKFDFLIHQGEKPVSHAQKKLEYETLIKYFMASLAIPEEHQWVNLSPYEGDRIIDGEFAKTAMGRDLLAQDYVLKQLTASLIYPKDHLGQEFWERVYARVRATYGHREVPINAFQKVWILPDEAVIYEKGNAAYILKSHLKVMLDRDYLALKSNARQAAPGPDEIVSEVTRSIVLPALEREVNEGSTFAQLRQVYSGMLLATWFKRRLAHSLLGEVYGNKAKLKGIDQDPRVNHDIYARYLQAYKRGVFSFIQEDASAAQGKSRPRKYFSGGAVDYAMAARYLRRDPVEIIHELTAPQAGVVQAEQAQVDVVPVRFGPVNGSAADSAMTADELQAILAAGYIRPSPLALSNTPMQIIEEVLRARGWGNREFEAVRNSKAFLELNNVLPYLKTVVDAVNHGYPRHHIIAFDRDADYLFDGIVISSPGGSRSESTYLFPGSSVFLFDMWDKVEELTLSRQDKMALDDMRIDTIAALRDIDREAILEKVGRRDALMYFDDMVQEALKTRDKEYFPFLQAAVRFVTWYRDHQTAVPGRDNRGRAMTRFLREFGLTRQAMAKGQPFLLLDSGFYGTAPETLRNIAVNLTGASGQSMDIKLVGVQRNQSEDFRQQRQLVQFQEEKIPDLIKRFPRTAPVAFSADRKGRLESTNGVVAAVLQRMPRYYGPSKFGMFSRGNNVFRVAAIYEKGAAPLDLEALDNLKDVNDAYINPELALFFQKTVVDYFRGVAGSPDAAQVTARAKTGLARGEGKTDSATLTPGGIDMNAARLNLEVKRDRNGNVLPVPQHDLAQFSSLTGLTPTILSISPAQGALAYKDMLTPSK